MSQLKYRIAIGKIVDGEWKHERYATPDEMAYLKPKADGSGVEKLRLSIHKAMVDGEFLATRIGIGHGEEIKLYGLWQDVSDTHRIEWGIELNGISYYENDILRCRYLYTEWDRTDCVVESENYCFPVDTSVKESLHVVKMIGGVMTLLNELSVNGEESAWDISSKALIHENLNLDLDGLIQQLPYQKLDQELADHLIDSYNLGSIQELCDYLSPVVLGNVNENPELLEAGK